MSYDELNEKANQLQDSVEKLATEMKKVTEQFAEAVESRVSVEVIEKQLLRMAPSMASTIFGNLCFILAKTLHGLRFRQNCLRRLFRNQNLNLLLSIVGLIMLKVRIMKIIAVSSI